MLDGGGHLEDATVMLEVWQRLWREFDVYVEVRDCLIARSSRRSPLPRSKQGRSLVNYLVHVGLLTVSQGAYKASCEEASRCLRGSWLEELGSGIAVAAGADEVRYGQKLVWVSKNDDQPHQSEVDVLARFGKRLVFISCKALTPLSVESYLGARRLLRAMKEVAFWRQQFGAGNGKAVLLTTADFVDEAHHRLRNAAVLDRAESLGVDLVSADTGDWSGLVEALQSKLAL